MSLSPPRLALLVIFLTVFVDLLGFGIVLPLAPIYAKQIAAARGLSPQEVTPLLIVLMTSFSVMQFLFAPLWGRLSDRVGRRPVLLIGLGGSSVFYALFAVAMERQSLGMLLAARIGAGVAGATIPTAAAYIADVTPRQGRTGGMALIGAAFGLGFTFGPLIGAIALAAGDAAESWPGFVAAGLSAGAALLAFFRLPESLHAESVSAARKHFDLASLRHALAIPSMGLLLAVSFAGVFALANLESTLALSIQSILAAPEGGNAAKVAARDILIVFAYIGLVQTAIQGGLVRWLARRTSEATLAQAGAIVSVAGFALLALTTGSGRGGVPALLAAVGVEVAGIALLSPAVQSLISRRSDPNQQGGILGLSESASTLARITGMAAGLYLLGRHPALPYVAACVLMGVGLLLVRWAVYGGADYAELDEREEGSGR